MNSTAVSNLRNRTLWEEYWKDRSSRDAFARLVETFMPLVRKVMRRIQIRLPSHVPQEDLVQSGLVGLFESIERFDPDKSSNFHVFASLRIRGAIFDELRKDDTLSRSTRDRCKSINKAIDELTVELRRSPLDEEIAERTGMPESEIHMILETAAPTISLDDVVVAARGGRPILLRDMLKDDTPGPDAETEKRDLIGVLCKAFRGLSDREQKILYLYYHEFLRIKEIAELFEVSEARICQIHALALDKLRAIVTAEQAGRIG